MKLYNIQYMYLMLLRGWRIKYHTVQLYINIMYSACFWWIAIRYHIFDIIVSLEKLKRHHALAVTVLCEAVGLDTLAVIV